MVAGGAGSAVAEALAAAGVTVPLLHLGLPDHFIDHGDPAFLLAQVGSRCEGNRRGRVARLRRPSVRIVGEAGGVIRYNSATP